MIKLKFKNNPCETHLNVETEDDWCPFCLRMERDSAIRTVHNYNTYVVPEKQREFDSLQRKVDKLRDILGAFAKIDLTKEIDPTIVYDILKARAILEETK